MANFLNVQIAEIEHEIIFLSLLSFFNLLLIVNMQTNQKAEKGIEGKKKEKREAGMIRKRSERTRSLTGTALIKVWFDILGFLYAFKWYF